MISQEKEADVNGDSAQNQNGVEPPDQEQQPQQMHPMGEKTYEEQVNHELNEAIKDDIRAVDPKVFEGVVEDLAQLMQEFKDQLPVYELLQFTNPDAYQGILKIVNTLTILSQLMLQNGDLPTDHDVVSQQMQEEIVQDVQAQGQEDGGGAANQDAAKTSTAVPIGSIRYNGVGGRPRIKTANGWKYVTKGLSGGSGAAPANQGGPNQGPGPQ